MARRVADVLWEILAEPGVKRCYEIVGDALNPVIDALRSFGEFELMGVLHEKFVEFEAVQRPT